jgi:hypothetical protein
VLQSYLIKPDLGQPVRSRLLGGQGIMDREASVNEVVFVICASFADQKYRKLAANSRMTISSS